MKQIGMVTKTVLSPLAGAVSIAEAQALADPAASGRDAARGRPVRGRWQGRDHGLTKRVLDGARTPQSR
jgi:hypothetical protein